MWKKFPVETEGVRGEKFSHEGIKILYHPHIRDSARIGRDFLCRDKSKIKVFNSYPIIW